MDTPGIAGGIKLSPNQDSINMAIGSGLVDSAVRDPTLNNAATSISLTANVDTISNSRGNMNNHTTKDRGLNSTTSHNGIHTASTGNDKHGNSDVNNISTVADNATTTVQTIALTPDTMTGTANIVNGGSNTNIINSSMETNSIQNAMTGPATTTTAAASNTAVGNSNSNANQNISINDINSQTDNSHPANNTNGIPMNNMNLNQYILASAGVPPVAFPTNTNVPMPPTSYNGFNANVTNPTTASTTDANNWNGNASATINNKQNFQSAILQQNAAIMQQNAVTLQHLKNLKNLQQTNKLLSTNPEAAAMLAPIMNMNLPTSNPIQLLATATPSLNSNNTGGATNVTTSTFIPGTTALQATTTNMPEVGGASTVAIAPASVQQQQSYHNQQQGVPVQAQPATIAIAPGGSQTFPVASIANNINMNSGSIVNSSNGIVDGRNNNNNDAVQNILRTAFMLQNSGLPFLQQGIVPQQHQMIPAPAGSGFMLVPNGNNNGINNPFGIVPVCASANNNIINDTTDNSSRSNESNSKRLGKSPSNMNNNGAMSASGAAAAANAAASVLPPASMNLPLQQQMQQQMQQQQQQLQQQQFNTSLSPQMGIDMSNNNNINHGSNNIQMGGLGTFQQQQRIQNMAYAPMTLPQSHSQLPLPLPLPQQQKHQHPALGSNLNPSTNQLKQNQLQPQKKKSISRPLYLDHDSNCLTAYQCFLRKQIELFEVGHDEMTGTAQGRNTPLHYGQVGIRCRHCAHLPKAARARGGVYYSRTIDGVYQVAQNMSKLHFLKACTLIPDSTKNQLKSLQSVSSRASGGKEYWAEGLRVLGIVEEGSMLRFAPSASSRSSTQNSKAAK